MKQQSKPIYQKMMKTGLGDIYDDREMPIIKDEEIKKTNSFSFTNIFNTLYYYLSYLFCNCLKAKKE